MEYDDYVFTVSRRDPEHPLTDKMILQFGGEAANPRAFIEAIAKMVELLRLLKTPEKVAEFMRENAPLAHAKKLILKGEHAK